VEAYGMRPKCKEKKSVTDTQALTSPLRKALPCGSKEALRTADSLERRECARRSLPVA
jgi:hypothetical protein